MADPNDVIRRLAFRQHGVVTRLQLLAAGVSAHVLDRRIRSGYLVAIYRGVYRLADREPDLWTLATAAILATRGASDATVAVSHFAAAALWDFPCWENPERMEVIGVTPRRVSGVRVHRVQTLGKDDVVFRRGVAVTSAARTVFDLASVLPVRELEQALAAAEDRARRCRSEIRELLRRYPHRRGSAQLRRLLATLEATRSKPCLLRSKAEALARDLIEAAGLPRYKTNRRVAGYEVDFIWAAHRVILEVDGLEFHGSTEAFHRDRDRDRTLVAAGYQVVRLSWRQLTKEREASLAALCSALYSRRP
jgi:very-short-patch-repair endonuclease